MPAQFSCLTLAQARCSLEGLAGIKNHFCRFNLTDFNSTGSVKIKLKSYGVAHSERLKWFDARRFEF